MIDQFEYTSPGQQVVFGTGSLDRLGQWIERFRRERLLLCTSGSSQRTGRVVQIQAALGARLVAVYDRVQPHVPDFQVAEALALAEDNAVDAVIGLGGGSSIGIAKAVSSELETRHAGKPDRAVLPTDQPLIPVIAIPTTYAGSEMTPVYGVTHHDGGTARKVTVTNLKIAPRLVLYDPRLTLDLPPDITASSGMNALAHCVEAVYSITRNPLSTAAALDGTRHIAHALSACCAHGDDMAARTEMLAGAYLAGTALANVAMGLHHGICHVLGGTAGVPHGVANAIILPHVMQFNSDVTTPELAAIARALGLDTDGQSDWQAARAGARRVYEWVGALRLPQHLREVGVDERDLPHLAELAAASRTVQNNPKPVQASDVAAILKAAWN